MLANRALHQRGDRAGVDAAADSAQHALAAHLCADSGDALLDKVAHRPVALAAAHRIQELAQQVHPKRRVRHFGMELHAVEVSLQIAHRRNGGVLGLRQHDKTWRGRLHHVAVAHPAGQVEVQLLEQRLGMHDGQQRAPVLALCGGLHDAAQQMRHQLMPVADAQHGDAQREQFRVNARGIRLVNTCGTARQDNPLRSTGTQVRQRRIIRQNLAEHITFAHAPRNQLRVLPTEV